MNIEFNKLYNSEIKLFEMLFDFEVLGKSYDLHNSFKVIKYKQINKNYRINFKEINGWNELEIKFVNATIYNSITEGEEEELTITNLSRGRIQIDNKLYDDFEGRILFYIEFIEDIYLEILCEGIVFQLSTKK